MCVRTLTKLVLGNHARKIPQRNPMRYFSFDEVVEKRRSEARRSVVIHFQSNKLVTGLLNYSKDFGQISNSFQYTLPNEKEFLLLEFNSEEDAANLISKISHVADSKIIPVKTRFLLYHATSQKLPNLPLPAEAGFDSTRNELNLQQKLLSASSLADQMQVLYDTERLSEVKSRLCFFTCLQIEEAYRSLFPTCKVLPFGSSVNGFGRMSCDLDMIMALDTCQIKEGDVSALLTFHNKCGQNNIRTQVQRYLEALSDTIKIFLPGCSNVQSILRARVPIIRFQHDLTGFECDLTMNNMSGYYMSELLYNYGEFDKRVRPLVFTVLTWARENQLTHDNPGHWITNFTLTLMVIFFLQTTNPPVLPSLSKLKKLAGTDDARPAESFTSTFLRDVHKFPSTSNTQNLGELLRAFFLYYANFNMEKNGICIVSGNPIAKPEYGSVYLRNPLEVELNVSKNMNSDELNRFILCVENSAWRLEHDEAGDKEVWGLARLFNDRIRRAGGQGEKVFQVKSLFSGTATLSKKTVNSETLIVNKARTVAASSGTKNRKLSYSRKSRKGPWVW